MGHFSLVPNPTNSQVRIVGNKLDASTWLVLDTHGQVVAVGNVTDSKLIELDLTPGLYFFQLGQAVEKLIIE